MADHGKIPTKTSVQVTVCAQMRAKLTSEVRENIEKLKKTPGECINVLGRACRTQCLANLHMTFPPSPYWRQSGPLPDYASEYVENYLGMIQGRSEGSCKDPVRNNSYNHNKYIYLDNFE